MQHNFLFAPFVGQVVPRQSTWVGIVFVDPPKVVLLWCSLKITQKSGAQTTCQTHNLRRLPEFDMFLPTPSFILLWHLDGLKQL